MNRTIARGFQTSSRALIQYAGAALDDVAIHNGPDGGKWSASTNSVCSAVEKADRSDKQKVITVGLQTHAGTRVGSLHVHIDGTFKFFPSRAGKDGGYGANIAAAAIPGYISCEDESAEGKASSVSNE